MDKNYIISSALADYLEAVYIISLSKKHVRVTDISNYLSISKPSVNRAVNTLKSNGLVTHEPYGDIILTDDGLAAGKMIRNRRTVIKDFLTNILSVNETDAENESRSMSRYISQNTVARMEGYMAHY